MLPNEGEGLGLRESLSDYETQRLSIEAGFRRSFFNTLSGPFLRARLRRKMMRNIKAEIGLTKGNLVDGQASLERFRTDLNRYFRATAKAEAYTLYERLFCGLAPAVFSVICNSCPCRNRARACGSFVLIRKITSLYPSFACRSLCRYRKVFCCPILPTHKVCLNDWLCPGI